MKLRRNMWLGIFSIALASAFAIVACNKENSASSAIPAGKQSVLVSLNDDPIPDLTSVLIDIRYVEVKVDTGRVHHEDDYYDDDHEGDRNEQYGQNNDNEGDNEHHHGDRFGKWDTLTVTPRIYDLLKLKNGKDTLIANGLSHIGKITKIRITLGPNNSVSTDSAHTYPLPICNGSPYVYLKVKSDAIDSLPGGQHMIRIDFNVAKSIEFEDGEYCLRPVLKTYCIKTTGSIAGRVLPRHAHPLIMAYNSTDTAYAMPEEEGEFEIRGLKEATYSVQFKAKTPYKDTTLTNIQVQKGKETKLPTITLHQ